MSCCAWCIIFFLIFWGTYHISLSIDQLHDVFVWRNQQPFFMVSCVYVEVSYKCSKTLSIYLDLLITVGPRFLSHSTTMMLLWLRRSWTSWCCMGSRFGMPLFFGEQRSQGTTEPTETVGKRSGKHLWLGSPLARNVDLGIVVIIIWFLSGKECFKHNTSIQVFGDFTDVVASEEGFWDEFESNAR